MKKTVLITGASSGFGLLLANHLHRQGFEVIGTSREPEKHADKVPFKLLRLDISDTHSISTFTDTQGIDEAQVPDAVVHTITQRINTIRPRFSNPVGKMTGMILFLQSYAPKLFERAILKSVKSA